MSRTKYTRRKPGRHGLVTPHIVQGSGADAQFYGRDVFARNCHELARAFRSSRYRARKQPVADLFAAVESRTTILHELPARRHRVVPLLVQIGSMHPLWKRALADWQPKCTAAINQLVGLVRYLFQLYPASAFFDKSWRPKRGEARDWRSFAWYVHVAGGGNIRTAPRAPASLSRRAAHEMMAAPGSLTAAEALRWGQLTALDLDPDVFWYFNATVAATDFANDDVWLVLLATWNSAGKRGRYGGSALTPMPRGRRCDAPPGRPCPVFRPWATVLDPEPGRSPSCVRSSIFWRKAPPCATASWPMSPTVPAAATRCGRCAVPIPTRPVTA